MLKCSCTLTTGKRKNQRCSNTAKYPAKKPSFCGIHKACRVVFGQAPPLAPPFASIAAAARSRPIPKPKPPKKKAAKHAKQPARKQRKPFAAAVPVEEYALRTAEIQQSYTHKQSRQACESQNMSWFCQAFGFEEPPNFREAQRQLTQAITRDKYINGISMGDFYVVSLKDFVRKHSGAAAHVTLEHIVADVTDLMQDPRNANATFQVASQFNCLEMASPNIRPADGITIYQEDNTQGPKCAMATPAGTAFRNYLVLLASEEQGQVRAQIDASYLLRRFLSSKQNVLGRFENGYVFFAPHELQAINATLTSNPVFTVSRAKEELVVGDHKNVGVCVNGNLQRHLVNLALCSGWPINYNNMHKDPGLGCSYANLWAYLSEVLLDAAYEATLHIAVANNLRNRENKPCYLTLVGGGVFGMPVAQIMRAIVRACIVLAKSGNQLDVKLVHYPQINPELAHHAAAVMKFNGREKVPQSVIPGYKENI